MNSALRHRCKQGLLTLAEGTVAQNTQKDWRRAGEVGEGFRAAVDLDFYLKKENFW